MKIKAFLIPLIAFSNISLFAFVAADQETKFSDERITISIKEGQQPDVSNWVTFPIKYEYNARGNESSGKENIQISFPVMPKQGITPLANVGNGLQNTFSATDEEGMIFSISAMQIPEDGFDVRKSFDALVTLLEKNPGSRIAACIPPQSPDTSTFLITWVKDNKMISLTAIKRTHFVYFLETTVSNEIYRDFESIEQNSAQMDTWMKDSLKSGAFFGSFATSDVESIQ
jgi:hypothetical protein